MLKNKVGLNWQESKGVISFILKGKHLRYKRKSNKLYILKKEEWFEMSVSQIKRFAS